jgi:hypothetical protein
VRRVPDEIGIEGRRGSREQADAPAEGEGAHPADRRDEERAQQHLGPKNGLHRPERAEEAAHEVRVDRGIEDQVAAKGREADHRPPDLPPDLDPARLVAGEGATGLDEQPGDSHAERGEGEGGEGPVGRGASRGRGWGGRGHETGRF